MAIGRLEVSGSESFVRDIYKDFCAELGSNRPVQTSLTSTATNKRETQAPDEAVKKVSKPKGNKTSSTAMLNKDLDVSGLKDYFSEFDTKKAAEQALIFTMFLREVRGIVPCTADDIYTCFFTMKDQLKLPSMTSLFNNDRARTGFFKRVENGKVEITQIGENHFNHNLKKIESSDD
ncbi:hypothetical protein [Aliiroseovarius sp. YM-037]|uniref:hypothetical protein n=1 Tax=Aliiroseovarius sp. YM-037 TaxID=3341728 RepID=UPI003A80E2DC